MKWKMRLIQHIAQNCPMYSIKVFVTTKGHFIADATMNYIRMRVNKLKVNQSL